MAFTPCLPQELWDEVVPNTPLLMITCIVDQSCQVVFQLQWLNFRRMPSLYIVDITSCEARLNVRILCQLRLVSKTFWRSATQALLNYNRFYLSAAHGQLLSRIEMIIDSPRIPGLSKFAPHIKHLSLDFTKPNARVTLQEDLKYAETLEERQAVRARYRAAIRQTPRDPREPYNEPNFLLARPFNHEDTAISRCHEMTRLLPTFLSNLKSLTSLEVKFPPWDVNAEGGGHEPIDVVTVERLVNGIAHSLHQPFEYLNSLYLNLLCTHDVYHLSKSLPESTKVKLNHLHIVIKDSTGPGGSDEYLQEREMDDGDDEEENEDTLSISDLQKKFPNARYMFAILDLLRDCPNLTALGLTGTHFLDCTNLSQASGKLEIIILERVRISAEKLLQLILPSLPGPCKLRYLWLRTVELTAGTWNDVFQTLILHTHALSILRISSLGYYRFGESKHLRVQNVRRYQSANEIWTVDESDRESLDAWKSTVRRGNAFPNIIKLPPPGSQQKAFLEAVRLMMASGQSQ